MILKYSNVKPSPGTQINWGHPLVPLFASLTAEGGGSITIDTTGLCYPGALTGGPGWIPGHHGGSAISYNGSSQYTEFAFGPALNGKYLTVIAWVKPGGLGNTYPRVVDRVYNGQFSAYLIASSNSMSGSIYGSSGSFDLGGVSLSGLAPSGVWSMLAWTYDGSLMRGYVNGLYTGSGGSAVGTLANSSSAIRIAARADGGTARHFAGAIGDVLIYSRALSSADIRSLYADPYCFLRPQSSMRRFWAIHAAGAAFQPAWSGCNQIIGGM